ncbi:hypothetical protein Nepgr_019670 [Nepenthes gracilis]|uniref:Uncharacterized protein n=1 Tax=Nepenthes gracilis TaxID=150966 RepID=A0AAD3SVM2_NEPGR|nr:hypothetical protein Nepgr_019670 [Nepenthes gracilis]
MLEDLILLATVSQGLVWQPIGSDWNWVSLKVQTSLAAVHGCGMWTPPNSAARPSSIRIYYVTLLNLSSTPPKKKKNCSYFTSLAK